MYFSFHSDLDVHSYIGAPLLIFAMTILLKVYWRASETLSGVYKFKFVRYMYIYVCVCVGGTCAIIVVHARVRLAVSNVVTTGTGTKNVIKLELCALVCA